MASSSLSNKTSSDLLNYLLKGAAAPTYPGSLWLALFTTAPDLGGNNGVEVNGGSYARVELPRVAGTWTGPGSGSNQEYSNSADLSFPQPTGNWGNVVCLGIFTESTGGDMVFKSLIATQKQISDGDGAPRILSGNLKILRAIC